MPRRIASRPRSRVDNPPAKTVSILAAGRSRIMVVDDHPLIREGLRGLINSQEDLVICGEAASAAQAREVLERLGPDLVLVDISMPGKSGLELIKDLTASHPGVPILTLSMHEEILYAERVLKAGAAGYITKQQPPEELLRAIRRVLTGRPYVSQGVSDRILSRWSGRQPANQAASMEILSDRELEMLRLMGDGRSLKEIAQQLHISPKTVAVHSANIRQKLGLKNTAQLIRQAVRWQALEGHSPS